MNHFEPLYIYTRIERAHNFGNLLFLSRNLYKIITAKLVK